MSIVLYLGLTALAIVGVRSIWCYITDWKSWLPLMVCGILLCSCGIAEAAVQSTPLIQCVTTTNTFWNVLGILFFIITIFI
jgi:hypothetical protein